MSRERVERKIERMLAEGEPAEPLEGLLERLQADIPPLDKIGGAHLRAALDQRRVRRLPALWLAAASTAFLMVGGSLAFRLWKQEATLGRERAPSVQASSAARGDAGPPSAPSSEERRDLAAPPGPIAESLPAPVPESEAVPGGVAGGVAGGTFGEARAGEASNPSPELSRDGEALETTSAAPAPWKTLAAEPGVQTDRIDVGGNESGQQSAFVPAEAPDGKEGKAAPATPLPASPPSGPLPILADERRGPAVRATEAAKPERRQAPPSASRGTNSAESFSRREAGSEGETLSEKSAAPPVGWRASVRFEAALLPWRRSGPARAVIGALPGPSPRKERAAPETREGEASRRYKSKPPQAVPEQGEQTAPALALRFEPTAVVRARWLGEEAWRLPGGWEGLAEREAAGGSSRLEVELRPGLRAEQVVAYVRFPESVRPLRMAEMSRSWEGASWELQAGALRAELKAAIADRGARLSPAERAALLERARSAEGSRPEDPRAHDLRELIRRFEEAMGRP